jgi:hypothetical protein
MAATVGGCTRSEWYPGAWELMVTVAGNLPSGEAAMTLEVDGIASPQARVRIE